mmetsp:Transcript_5915/g.17009  ORF Transcript_5915/g.17009 Transcript_5915/m.17009 type:complete len:302 (+) Transcript_5915:1039-1944(+)
MSTLCGDMNGGHPVNVRLLLGVCPLLNHVCQLFEIFRGGLCDFVHVGPQFDETLRARRMSPRGRKHDRGTAREGCQVDVFLQGVGGHGLLECRQDRLQTLQIPLTRHGHEGRDSVHILPIDRSTALEKERYRFGRISRGRLNEGRSSVGVSGVNVHPSVFQQCLHHLDSTGSSGVHEGGDAILVGAVLIGTGGNEVAHDVDVPMGRSDNDGGESGAGQGINVFFVRVLTSRGRLDQCLDHCHGPVLGRVVEGGQTLPILGTGVRTPLQQQLDRLRVSAHRRGHDGRNTINTSIGRIRPLFQ